MHARALVLFCVLVAALGGLAWWQHERESAGAFDASRPLVEGFDPGRIARLRVDNLERDVQLALERDEEGRWRITDPIGYPAEPAVIAMLFDALATTPASEVRGAELAKLGFDPPRAVLQIFEGPGPPAARRIEVGALDLDGEHVFARVDGTVVRTLRSLDSALERDLLGWRRGWIFDVPARSIVEFARSGSIRPAAKAEPVDLELEAIDDGSWHARRPHRVRLDPGALGVLLTGLATLRAASFVDDAPIELAHYGLDTPALRFEIATATEERFVLRLAPMPDSVDWYALLEGRPNVYRVAAEALVALTTPAEKLYDRELVRTVRERVTRARLRDGGRETTLERRGYAWSVSESLDGQTTLAPAPADRGRVEDLLGGLERARVLEFAPALAPARPFAGPAFEIEADGELQGGTLGPLQRTADGEGLLFLRDGDELPAVIAHGVLALVRTSADELRSLELFQSEEREVAKLRLQRGREQRAYVRVASGAWSREGSEVEAREFEGLVDRLLHQRAVRHLAPSETAAALEEVIDVAVIESSGRERGYRLGTASLAAPKGQGEGEGQARAVICEVDGRQAEVAPELHAELLALLERE